MAPELAIDARFNGPPGSANGGYTCGLLAGHLGGPAEVALRAPPPLARPLSLEREGEALLLRDGEQLVAEARPGDPGRLEPPRPVSVAQAERASREGYEQWASHHPFPTCVVCGPSREAGDGLRVFPGAVGDSGLYAAPWVPAPSLAGVGGTVAPECVWASLDCPTSAPVANFGSGPPLVLARMTARLEGPVEAGRPHVLVAWELGREGRKREAASALLTEDGELRGLARALWIELRPE